MRNATTREALAARLVMLAMVGAGISVWAGCSAEDAELDCGTGELARVDGEQYCLYSSELIIEGFDCPLDLQANQVPGGVVCGPSNMPLPGELEMPFPCNGEAWCFEEPNNQKINNQSPNNQTSPLNNQTSANNTSVNNTTANNTSANNTASNNTSANNTSTNNTSPTNNTTAPDLIPTPSGPLAYDKLAIYGLSACAYNAQGAQCWGDNSDGRLEVPSDLGFEQMSLGPGAGCGIVSSSRIAMDCWGDTGDTYLVPAPIGREIHTLWGAGCWIDGGTGQLGCFDASSLDVGLRPLFGAQEPEGAFGTADFATVDLRGASPQGRISTVCGVTSQGALICSSNGAELNEAANYVQVRQNGTARVCALSSTGSIDCWDLLGYDRLTSPPGTYEALYSTSCGLRDDGRVVCWGALGLQENGGPVEVEVLYHTRPRAFAIDPTGNQGSRSWCAIEADGQLTCSF